MEKRKHTGKIAGDAFRDTIWTKTGAFRNEVKVGPCYGTDVSVVELHEGFSLATASDPLSLVPTLGLAESAWLSVHLTANDLATTGYAPMYGQFVLNLPTWLSDTDFKIYWDYIHSYCADIGMSITGGHTGRVPGQESTIVGGATFSLVAPSDKILTSNLAKPGQTVILTKGSALSSTAILALSFPDTVKQAAGLENWQQLCEQFYQTSVLTDGLAAHESGFVTAMHDVTEGGVLGAVIELCDASGCGAVIQTQEIFVSDAVKRVADRFGFDPTRSIGAGAMLMVCQPNHVSDVLQTLNAHGVTAFEIGHTTVAAEGIKLMDGFGKSERLMKNSFDDPYWNAYFSALEQGWK